MKKNATMSRSAVSGRFVTKPLGKRKATKFAQVEGMSLNARAAGTISSLEERGLKGDALRSAITGRFIAKRG